MARAACADGVGRLLGWLTIAAILWGGWALFSMKMDDWRLARHVNLLPPELRNVTEIYASEKSFGVGPGGNETGIIVFEMSAALQDGMIRDFAMPASGRRRARTPVPELGDCWFYLPRMSECGGIRAFLFRWG